MSAANGRLQPCAVSRNGNPDSNAAAARCAHDAVFWAEKELPGPERTGSSMWVFDALHEAIVKPVDANCACWLACYMLRPQIAFTFACAKRRNVSKSIGLPKKFP